MRIAFITSEIMPYSKTGGLADVSKGLTNALKNYTDLICITPLYSNIDTSNFEKLNLEFDVYGERFSVFKDKHIYFLKADIFDRIYGYEDDEIRFSKFCFGVLELLNHLGDFDIIHLNDWQTSLLAFLLKRKNTKAEVILTIHNLAYQGITNKDFIDMFNLGWENFTFDKFEFYDRVNLLKSGIVFCDKFNTVSKEYAKEIQTPTFSEGLGSVISEHSYKLTGILNGIDYNDFNPEIDRHLIKNYTYETIHNKGFNKNIILKYFNLENNDVPLFAFIGRFTNQKGIDLIVNNAEFFSSLNINFVILGDGELSHIVEPLNKYKNIRVYTGYNESLARMIYASSDFFVMPSVFEPCGLGQMISASYGCIPIVSSVGGLIDTVDEYKNDKIYGFRFFVNHYDMFKQKILEAIELYKDKDTFINKSKENMKKRFSWDKSAKKYLEFYKTKPQKTVTKSAEIKPQEHDIPSYYIENRAHAMNVNPELIFVYWNVEPALIKKYNNLKIAVIDSNKIIFAHDIASPYGEYFLNYPNGMKKLEARIGIFDGGRFVDIIERERFLFKFKESAEIADITEFEGSYYGS